MRPRRHACRWPRRATASLLLTVTTLLGTGIAPGFTLPASAAFAPGGGPGGGAGLGGPQGFGGADGQWRYDDSALTLDEVNQILGELTSIVNATASSLPLGGLRSPGTAVRYTGKGIGVALVDTGVVPVPGLTSGNVVNGPDLSFESQVPSLRYHDTNGHGTHLAGIIAGRDPGIGTQKFRGVAPDVELTSVKVGTADGTVDVSQVIAAIDWVVEHRNDDRANPIRVLTLAYGTDGAQDYRIDPLTHAVENAWRAGIVVVVAAGNDGTTQPTLVDPAYDPYVLAVGAADSRGTAARWDDRVADFSSRGDATRRVDLVAPGRSIVSLRNPGSYVDEAHPQARVGERFFKGSGTSQAAAVAAGSVAVLLQQHPSLTPDQVKAVLRSTAAKLAGTDPGAGAGMLDLAAASAKVARRAAPSPSAALQKWPASTGTGSLEATRGSYRVIHNGVTLTGQRDIFGPLDGRAWAKASGTAAAWNAGRWMDRAWTGGGWTARSWSGTSWAGSAWPGTDWSGAAWAGTTWSGAHWSGAKWNGAHWNGAKWNSALWTGAHWNGAHWNGARWNVTRRAGSGRAG